MQVLKNISSMNKRESLLKQRNELEQNLELPNFNARNTQLNFSNKTLIDKNFV